MIVFFFPVLTATGPFSVDSRIVSSLRSSASCARPLTGSCRTPRCTLPGRGRSPIFHHNALDILWLACLTAIVPFAFRSPADAAFGHGADHIGLARWLLQAERQEEALRLFRRALAIEDTP